jgi:hypothetical protein
LVAVAVAQQMVTLDQMEVQVAVVGEQVAAVLRVQEHQVKVLQVVQELHNHLVR